MSHQLGLEGVQEKLVLLEHFASGSREYCRTRLAGSEEDHGDGILDEYWGWVKTIVSSSLIECAVRARILQDTLREKEAEQLARLDESCRADLTVGTIVSGDFELSLRETCNKIIHAKKAVPEWALDTEGGIEFRYWSGDYRLSGTKGSEAWDLILHISQWARAMARYFDEAESAELTLNVGQDWY
jgi:hypothetical protein